jgi:hypothetical protein
MPRGDGSGPSGMGPMTGRGMGYCTGNSVPGYANYGRGSFGAGFGSGFRRGYGRGFGFRRAPYFANQPVYNGDIYYPDINYSDKEVLENQKGALEKQLESVKERIKSLEKEK